MQRREPECHWTQIGLDVSTVTLCSEGSNPDSTFCYRTGILTFSGISEPDTGSYVIIFLQGLISFTQNFRGSCSETETKGKASIADHMNRGKLAKAISLPN